MTRCILNGKSKSAQWKINTHIRNLKHMLSYIHMYFIATYVPSKRALVNYRCLSAFILMAAYRHTYVCMYIKTYLQQVSLWAAFTF